jgi:hypothetical protein
MIFTESSGRAGYGSGSETSDESGIFNNELFDDVDEEFSGHCSDVEFPGVGGFIPSFLEVRGVYAHYRQWNFSGDGGLGECFQDFSDMGSSQGDICKDEVGWVVPQDSVCHLIGIQSVDCITSFRELFKKLW